MRVPLPWCAVIIVAPRCLRLVLHVNHELAVWDGPDVPLAGPFPLLLLASTVFPQKFEQRMLDSLCDARAKCMLYGGRGLHT